jgi:hypothetical protein
LAGLVRDRTTVLIGDPVGDGKTKAVAALAPTRRPGERLEELRRNL